MIAYLTHDEVNAYVAARLARKLRVPLTVLPAKGTDQLAAHVLLVDLDHLPREWRANLLARAARGRLPAGLAVHSYHLSGADARTLRAAGVRVAHRLTAALLTGAADSGPAENARSENGSTVL